MKKLNNDAINKSEEFVEISSKSSLNSSLDTKLLIGIDKKLSKICKDLNEKSKEEKKLLKWKYTAICLDKTFFYIALIGFFLSFLSTILVVPQLYQTY